MSNFARLFENMDSFRKSKKDLEDRMAMDAIMNGMNIDENFWKSFLLLLNSPESLAKLLNVPSHKVTEWYGRISKYLNKFLDSDESEGVIKPKKKKRLIKTSDFEDFI